MFASLCGYGSSLVSQGLLISLCFVFSFVSFLCEIIYVLVWLFMFYYDRIQLVGKWVSSATCCLLY